VKRVGVVLLALAAVRCGGGGTATPTVETAKRPTAAPTTAVTTTTIAVTDAGSIARDFFQAAAAYDPDRHRKMLGLSLPGSPAHLYAKFQVATLEATLHRGQQPPADDTVQVTTDAIKICGAQSGQNASDCTAFTGFIADTRKLTSFQVNGLRIDDRLVDGQGRPVVQAGGASFALVAAYELVTRPSLSMVIEVRNGPAALNLNGFRTRYVGADGRQVSNSGIIGPGNLRPSATAKFWMTFDGATKGGRLYASGLGSDLNRFEAVIPV
jgi:hypothetical protein